jgi:subtilase family serine protease
VRTPSDHKITADTSGSPSTALGPADIQSAYNLSSATAGSGATVAVVDAGDDPYAESDLAVFRSQYGLHHGQRLLREGERGRPAGKLPARSWLGG